MVSLARFTPLPLFANDIEDNFRPFFYRFWCGEELIPLSFWVWSGF